MDGIHDLGGLQGFGPLEIDPDPRPFKHDWEARVYGLSMSVKRPASWNLDWWRHVRELIMPIDYLTRPYFEQWAQIYAALLIDSGMASIEEVASGKADGKLSVDGAPMGAPEVPEASKRMKDYTRHTNAKPAFAVGETVFTKSIGEAGHTRLPRYARAKEGRVHAYRGIHVLPDASALGQDYAEPLYTVSFSAAEFFPDAAGRRDFVYLDLWESYLEL